MDKIKRQFTIKNFVQFVKLQLAGNILFWGTLIGSFVFHELLNWTEFAALLTASIIAHILFFIADKEWVFNEGHDGRKSSGEVWRFIAFMTLNFFINLAIVTSVDHYLDTNVVDLGVLQTFNERFDVNLYLAQFVSALFFTFWTYIGLKYWVFRRPLVLAVKRKSTPSGSRKSTK